MAEIENDSMSVSQENITGKATLVCSDGKIENIDLNILQNLKTIKNMLDDIDDNDDDNQNIEIPLELSVPVVQKIINFAKDNLDLLETVPDRITNLTESQLKYIPQDEDEIFELIKACNFLDFSYMLSVICKHIAFTIREMEPQQYHETVKELNNV